MGGLVLRTTEDDLAILETRLKALKKQVAADQALEKKEAKIQAREEKANEKEREKEEKKDEKKKDEEKKDEEKKDEEKKDDKSITPSKKITPKKKLKDKIKLKIEEDPIEGVEPKKKKK